jgi:hypothetical protein
VLPTETTLAVMDAMIAEYEPAAAPDFSEKLAALAPTGV